MLMMSTSKFAGSWYSTTPYDVDNVMSLFVSFGRPNHQLLWHHQFPASGMVGTRSETFMKGGR